MAQGKITDDMGEVMDLVEQLLTAVDESRKPSADGIHQGLNLGEVMLALLFVLDEVVRQMREAREEAEQ